MILKYSEPQHGAGGFYCSLCNEYVYATYDHKCVPRQLRPSRDNAKFGFDPVPMHDTATELARIATALERVIELLEKNNG